MPKISERVLIRGARLSFPALDEPRAGMDANSEPKYQATFLLEPSNPSIPLLQAAIEHVAKAEYGDRYMQVLQNPEKNPLRSGDARERIPEGYAGMMYVSAKSKNPPELRDANPRILITDKVQIREKFVPGYVVNGFVDIYPYAYKNAQGAVIKSGISVGLVSVQFCAYADAFSGVAKPDASEYPDCSAEAEASSSAGFAGTYATPAAAPANPWNQQAAAPANPWAQQQAQPAPVASPWNQQAPAAAPANPWNQQAAAPANPWAQQQAQPRPAPAPAAPTGGMWYPGGGEPGMQQDDLPF